MNDLHAWCGPDAEEEVARSVVNGFARRESIVMPKFWWRYYDWMAEEGYYVAAWTRQLDLERGDYPFGKMVHYALWAADCRAYLRDGHRPEGLPPPQCLDEFPDDNPGDPVIPERIV